MGQTPGAAEANQRAREQRQWAELMTKATPEGLTETEAELSHYLCRKAPQPRPVLGTLRGPPGEGKGWTSVDRSGVKVRWLTPLIVWHEAWLWEGAVQSRQVKPNEQAGECLGLSPNAPRER